MDHIAFRKSEFHWNINPNEKQNIRHNLTLRKGKNIMSFFFLLKLLLSIFLQMKYALNGHTSFFRIKHLIINLLTYSPNNPYFPQVGERKYTLHRGEWKWRSKLANQYHGQNEQVRALSPPSFSVWSIFSHTVSSGFLRHGP